MPVGLDRLESGGFTPRPYVFHFPLIFSFLNFIYPG
jgi:hypothetical protein